MRSFSEWKAQVAVWLMSLGDRGQKGEYDFRQQRDRLATRLRILRANMLPSILLDLHQFCSLWDLEFPQDLLPSQEEVREWLRGGG